MLERWTNQARNPLYSSPLPLLFYARKMGPSDDPVKFVDGSRAVREPCEGPRAFRASLVKLMNEQNILVLRLSESGT